MKKDSNQIIGTLIVVICGIMWGLSGVLNQLIFMNSDIKTITLCGIRSTLSGVLLLTIMTVRKGKKTFSIWKNRKDILVLLLFVIIGVMGMQFTYSEAIRQSNAATATVLQYVYPILMLIYTSIKTKKLPKRYEFVAILTAFMGVFLIATNGKINSLCITPMALITGMMAAFTYLFYTVFPDKMYDRYGVITIAAWAQLIGGLLFTFVMGGCSTSFEVDVKTVLFIIGSMCCGTLIPFAIYGIGVRMIGGVRASLFVTIEPVASAIMAFFILGIRFSFIDIIGFTCIIGAIEIVSIKSA